MMKILERILGKPQATGTALKAVSDMFQCENTHVGNDYDFKGELVEKIKTVDEEIKKWDKISKELYGIERDARITADDKLRKLEKEKRVLITQLGFSRWYPRISLEPLRWRDRKGLPKLALFSLYEKTSEIRVTKDRNIERPFIYMNGREGLPYEIEECYEDVANTLGKYVTPGSWVSIKATFNGVIPHNVREEIKKAKKDFPPESRSPGIFVLAETEFKINREVSLPPDPLVLGFKEGALFLIADFETTSLEEAVVFYNDHS